MLGDLMPRALMASLLGGLLLTVSAPASAQDNPLSSCKVSRMTKIEFASKPVSDKPDVLAWTFTGSTDIPVEIVCDDTTISADEMHYRDDEDIVYASGHVVFRQKGTHVSSDKAELNRKTHQGVFYDAFAVLQLSNTGIDRSMFGAQEPDAIFYGERIEKIGDQTYKLTNGAFTTCDQPTPRWEMTASSIVFVADKHATLRHMVLKVKDVPLFYVPALYYPINKENRATGFLMPQYGGSTVGGFNLGNAFFWAIDRSQDATFFHDYYSRSGQAYASEYRYAQSPGSQGRGYFRLFNEKEVLGPDGITVVAPPRRSYTIQGNVSQALGTHFRASGYADYFSSVEAQQLYQQNIEDRTNRHRTLSGDVLGSWGQYRLAGRVAVTDTFYGTPNRQGVAPEVAFGIADKPIGHSRIYYGLTSQFDSFVRQLNLAVPTPATSQSLWRADVYPTIRAPLSPWPFLTATTSASMRFTHWSESLDSTGAQVDVPLTRPLLEYDAAVTGPMFMRIFNTPDNGYAEKFKHLISPTFTIQRFSQFDDFDHIVKFDYIDQVPGGYTLMRYGVTNRVLAKRKHAPTGASSEILSVDVTQTYYSVAKAASADQEFQANVDVKPSSNFSPIRIVATGRPSDETSAWLQMEIDHQYHALRNLNANGTFNSRSVQVTGGWSKHFVIPQLPGYGEAQAIQTLIASITVRQPEGHLGGTWTWLWDIHQQLLQRNRVTGFYNSQCCGLAVEYQREVFPQSIRGVSVDRRINFSFMLAGLGTFANPLGSFFGR